MAIGKKIFLIIVSTILAIIVLFNIIYKMTVGIDCCSCCGDSQQVCISACCRCTFLQKIEKIVKVFNK